MTNQLALTNVINISVASVGTGVNAYNWQITMPAIPAPGTNAAQTINFAAHVISLGATFEKDKMIVAPVKLKVTGNPNL
mgnify:CR=1 FL=1